MGEFSLSGNANIGLSAVEISVNSAKSSQNTLFYTTPTSTTSGSGGTGNEIILQAKSYSSTMQDELTDKAVAAVSVSGSNADDLSSSVVGSTVISSTADKNTVTTVVKDCEIPSNPSVNDLTDKLNEQVAQTTKTVPSLPPLFHPAEASTPAGALWSTAIEDGYVPNLASVNGGMGFQNFPSPTQQQLFGNNLNQNQVNQGRRAITASHNFPHNMGRQQSMSSHPLYKNYSSWANPPGQNWAPGNSSVWNRGRSVPNLTPLQQMGVGLAGRKPSPTFNQQQVISPVKFRRSTSYPGKGPFPQPPTFEITNMDEARELLPYQDRCVVSANGSSPLENMRGLEHYLNDIMSPQSNADIK
ncbi:hypothetical protein NQ315_010280, partial [Exocentrus adspersus]